MNWLRNNSIKPECLSFFNYIWTYSSKYRMELHKASAPIDWSSVTHWKSARVHEVMPPNEKD